MLFFISILMSHTLSNYLVLGFLATYLTNFVKIDETHASLAIFIAQMVLMATVSVTIVSPVPGLDLRGMLWIARSG
ncbi:hypothetical protein [Bradyrhizobium vignae]|nr:hypothetical protein EAV90_22635 [Bradyrhizobium vignae]